MSRRRCQMLIALALLFAVLALILYGLYAFFPTHAGMVQAKIDIWRGHYEIRACSFHYHPERLAERYERIGVEYRSAVDDPSDSAGLKRMLGYNSVMWKAIRKKYPIPSLSRDPRLLDSIKK